MVEYFMPLINFLRESNAGLKCGWDGRTIPSPAVISDGGTLNTTIVILIVVGVVLLLGKCIMIIHSLLLLLI